VKQRRLFIVASFLVLAKAARRVGVSVGPQYTQNKGRPRRNTKRGKKKDCSSFRRANKRRMTPREKDEVVPFVCFQQGRSACTFGAVIIIDPILFFLKKRFMLFCAPLHRKG
jgi:hypothetical protein